MHRNGYLWTPSVNLDTAVRFADPDVLLECKISAIWRRFPFIFAFYMPNVRHISTSGFTYWPKKYTTRVDPTLIIPTKFEVDMTIHCRVTAFFLRDPPCMTTAQGQKVKGQRHQVTWRISRQERCNSAVDIIKVICENNARPVLKKRMRFCACAKSRDLFKVA